MCSNGPLTIIIDELAWRAKCQSSAKGGPADRWTCPDIETDRRIEIHQIAGIAAVLEWARAPRGFGGTRIQRSGVAIRYASLVGREPRSTSQSRSKPGQRKRIRAVSGPRSRPISRHFAMRSGPPRVSENRGVGGSSPPLAIASCRPGRGSPTGPDAFRRPQTHGVGPGWVHERTHDSEWDLRTGYDQPGSRRVEPASPQMTLPRPDFPGRAKIHQTPPGAR
jgi:hypothetical protein